MKNTARIVLIGFLGGLAIAAPLCLGDSTVKVKSVRPIEGHQWFPESLSVVFTNHGLYYVPDPVAYRSRPALKDCQRLQRGGILRIRKGDGEDDERGFSVIMILSNAAMLSVHGALQQKTIPLVFIDR